MLLWGSLSLRLPIGFGPSDSNPYRGEVAPNDAIVSVNHQCSGFIAGGGLVVTAAHCLNEGPVQIVVFSDYSIKEFQLMVNGEPASQTDWAILAGPTGERSALEIQAEPLEHLAPLGHIRFVDFEERQEFSTGAFNAVSCGDQFGCMLEVILPVQPGDSGGAIIDLRTGKVIGLMSMGYHPMGVALGLAVPAAEFADFVEAFSKPLSN